MELKGLSRYDVTEQDGTIIVWNRKLRRKQTYVNKGFTLTCDDGQARWHTVGHLRYLMAHPAADACSINLTEMRVRFREDGTPTDLYPKSHTAHRYRNFRDIDDVQRTVDIMRKASEGRMDAVFEFLTENLERAVVSVAGILRMNPGKLRPHLGGAQENFINEVKTAKVQRIMPLYAWLCKCIKCAYLRSKRKPMQSMADLTLKKQHICTRNQ